MVDSHFVLVLSCPHPTPHPTSPQSLDHQCILSGLLVGGHVGLVNLFQYPFHPISDSSLQDHIVMDYKDDTREFHNCQTLLLQILPATPFLSG